MTHLDYIKTWFNLELIYLKEYKINLYMTIIISFIFTFCMSTFIYTFKYQFGDLIYWNFNQIFFFIFFSGVIALSIGLFYFSQHLSGYLLNGIINNYLIRPKNIFVQYFFQSTKLFVGVAVLPYILILGGFFILKPELFAFNKFVIVYLFSMFAGITLVLVMRIFDSLSFFMKNSRILLNAYQTPKGQFDMVPSIIFKNGLALFALLFPNIYYNSIATNYYFGFISFTQLLVYLLYLIIIFISSIFLNYFLWKFGLKKYEAYN